MRRREFIGLLGGAVAWPLAARAQQDDRVRRIGVLMNYPSDDPEAQIRVGAFLQGLQEHGWSVGRNVRIEYRYGALDLRLATRPPPSTAERKLGTHFSLAGERFCFHGPAEGLGHGLVEIGDELLDLGAQRFLAGEIAATEELSRQDREPDLDLIEP